jgi:hypothetical protein
MRRIMIVVVAGLAFGVTAAYASTGQAGSNAPSTPKAGGGAVFAPSAATVRSTDQARVASDDPAGHDQADDRGVDERSPAATSTNSSGQDDASRHDSSRDDNSRDDTSPDDSRSDRSGSEGDDASGGGDSHDD